MAPAPGLNCYPSETPRIFWMVTHEWHDWHDGYLYSHKKLGSFPMISNSFISWLKELAVIRLEFIQAKDPYPHLLHEKHLPAPIRQICTFAEMKTPELEDMRKVHKCAVNKHMCSLSNDASHIFWNALPRIETGHQPFVMRCKETKCLPSQQGKCLYPHF